MKSRVSSGSDKQSISYVTRELLAGGIAGSVVSLRWTVQLVISMINNSLCTGKDSCRTF